ncbi:MAG: pilin [Candidatus Magasanikiibacteriota bacterium]
MKNLKRILFVVLCFGLFLSLSPVVSADVFNDVAPGPDLGLTYGEQTGLKDYDPRLVVARIINAILGILGILSVCIVIYAGFKWMMSGGNEEEITSARKMLFAAVAGLVIILSAYSISRFVTTQLYKATTGNTYSDALNEQ